MSAGIPVTRGRGCEVCKLRAELANRPSEWLVKATIKERDLARAELAQEKAAHSETFKQCDRMSSAVAASSNAHGKTLAELAQAREEIESQRVQLEANHEWEACAENELAQAKEEIERLKEQVATEASMAATDPELRYVAKEAVKRHLAARKAGGGE